MLVRGTTTTVVVLGFFLTPLAATSAASAPARKATPVTAHAMPFPCGQTWTGTTRGTHSPSSLAIDWNRPDDLGEPVVASAPGVVTTANKVSTGGYGRYVVIDHGSGEDSLYAHLSVVSVAVGQRVDQGMLIGNVGSTGNSTGPHLHFEERKDRKVLQPYLHGEKFAFGTSPTSQNCVDVPLAVDWYGNGLSQVSVFRRAARAEFRIYRPGKSPVVRRLGTATDEPVLGNWDGVRGANIGVFTPSTKTFTLKVPGGTQRIKFGSKKDKPVAGDWNGDGTSNLGVWKPHRAQFTLRSAKGAKTKIRMGKADDLPVVGDWDGDGVTDVGVYDPRTTLFTLRKVDQEGTVWFGQVRFGKPGDLPVAGDWDRNGRSDLGVWTPSTGVFTQRIANTATTVPTRPAASVTFGQRR